MNNHTGDYSFLATLATCKKLQFIASLKWVHNELHYDLCILILHCLPGEMLMRRLTWHLYQNNIHLFPICELNTQMSVLNNKAAAKSSISVPHVQFLLILDFTT